MVQNELIQIIKSVLTGSVKTNIQSEDWQKLISLAKIQSVLPCVAFYAESLPESAKPEPQIADYLKKALFQATVFSANQLHAVKEMQNALEAEGVYSVKLKGSCTKLRYRSDVLRSMGDIDILYKPEQHTAFRSILENKLHYGNFQEGRKNDTYDKAPSLHIEAHRELVAADSFFAEYYSHVWDRCTPIDGCTYSYEMSLEDEFIFNFIHLTEHFKNGGIGVRFIMDIFVYEQLQMDFDYVYKVLDSFGLLDFYQNISKLSKVWFSDEEATELTNRLASYIFSGGTFGNTEHANALAVSHGGKFGFFMKTCFPNYENMVSMFPWLNGKKILLPIAWIIRAFRSLLHRKDNLKIQMQAMQNGDAQKGEAIKAFYADCGFPKDIF